MAVSASSVEVTEKIKDILEGAKTRLGLQGVYYGDTDLIPKFPSATVESGAKGRTITGVHKFELNLITNIFIYHGKLQGASITRKETEEFAELVETELHRNKTLDGLIIFGFVASMDPGVVVKSSVMLRTTRLIWQGISRETFV